MTVGTASGSAVIYLTVCLSSCEWTRMTITAGMSSMSTTSMAIMYSVSEVLRLSYRASRLVLSVSLLLAKTVTYGLKSYPLDNGRWTANRNTDISGMNRNSNAIARTTAPMTCRPLSSVVCSRGGTARDLRTPRPLRDPVSMPRVSVPIVTASFLPLWCGRLLRLLL